MQPGEGAEELGEHRPGIPTISALLEGGACIGRRAARHDGLPARGDEVLLHYIHRERSRVELLRGVPNEARGVGAEHRDGLTTIEGNRAEREDPLGLGLGRPRGAGRGKANEDREPEEVRDRGCQSGQRGGDLGGWEYRHRRPLTDSPYASVEYNATP